MQLKNLSYFEKKRKKTASPKGSGFAYQYLLVQLRKSDFIATVCHQCRNERVHSGQKS